MGADLGKLILRIAVGGLMIGHGIHKITEGIDGVKAAVLAKDLPEFVSYGVYVGEVLAPVLIIVGFQTRIAALILSVNMAVAVYLVHWNELLEINKFSGAPALELQLFYFLSALAIALIGAGAISIDGRKRGPIPT